jgi:acetyltransferase
MNAPEYIASMDRVTGASCPPPMTARRIAALMNPASVVLVGASDVAGSLGDVVRRNLAGSGFEGPVHFVNVRHESVAGQLTYRSVRDLPQPADLAVIVTPAASVPGIVEECGERGIQGAIIVSAGFGEVGAEGSALEAELRARARTWDRAASA